jgi:glutathione S-transferase
MSTFEHGTGSPWVEYAVAAFEKMFKRLETTLGEGGPWIMGNAATLADVNLMPYVARLHFLGLLDIWIDARPLVRAWWARVQTWPSFQAGLIAPMQATEISEMATHGPVIADEIRRILSTLRKQ